MASSDYVGPEPVVVVHLPGLDLVHLPEAHVADVPPLLHHVGQPELLLGGEADQGVVLKEERMVRVSRQSILKYFNNKK